LPTQVVIIAELPEYLIPQDALTGHSGLSVARRCEDVRVFALGIDIRAPPALVHQMHRVSQVLLQQVVIWLFYAF
jgi:hypothetical protein